MKNKPLGTDSYKGVRDFYPEDMAIQSYIYETWASTAESFGFERYDASILEPAELYKAKGAENEEMVNEQTYTFNDRGERDVTLRPEMTPTVARMVAGKRRDLQFPLRWYSIPNLFRYERPQRGRLREHWQLNCDIFGCDDVIADIEIITLAAQTLKDFGATQDLFEIKVNNRALLNDFLLKVGIDENTLQAVLAFIDRKSKMDPETFRTKLNEFGADQARMILETFEAATLEELPEAIKSSVHFEKLNAVVTGCEALGVPVTFEPSIVRGFNYYTGTIFEVFDTASENRRALLGGGRYDNLTSMFGGDPISGVGFGMGDVTMRDFLETHGLFPGRLFATAPMVIVIPTDTKFSLEAEKIALQIRTHDLTVATDIGNKRFSKKIGEAGRRGARFVAVVGEEEIERGHVTIKNLSSGDERSGPLHELIDHICDD